MRDWTPISCAESDELRPALTVISSCTDMSGYLHSQPQIDTTWGTKDGTEVLREARYPSLGGGPDRKPCEHWKRAAEGLGARA